MTTMLNKLFAAAPTSVAEMPAQLIPNENGPGFSLILPERPEPERKAPVQLAASEIVRRFGLASAEDIDTRLMPYGFPTAAAHRYKSVLGGSRRESLYDAVRVDEWHAAIRRLAGA